ncbi:MAG: alpha-amylase family glycosyl hydrolase [Thiotrichales bacterium]
MSFRDDTLNHPRPASIRTDVALPRRERHHPSPADWRDEVLYFLLVDRFSDGAEASRPLLDRAALPAARPAIDGAPWRWDRWAASGADRWQGGTLEGVRSKLDYLQALGVTTIWLSPVFRQRAHLDTFHGYGIQDFLDVDPHFGDRRALVELVEAAHTRGLRIILDIIFNHSGANWVYPGGVFEPPYLPPPLRYPFGAWLDADGHEQAAIEDPNDGVWPTELQDVERYTRAGSGSLGAGDLGDAEAEHKRSDFLSLRDFRLGDGDLLNDLARCYKYWIALTDCDGFRIDTLKHVSFEEARNFCGTIKEFTNNLGKNDFFLVGEIAGGDFAQARYLNVLERNLNAALDIGEMRLALNGLAKGLQHPDAYFGGFASGAAAMGSHRNLGERHVSILDDHDHVFGAKIRFASEAASSHQVFAGVALQLFTLGVPCLYYGTEQALAGPELAERHWLPDWKGSDRYLREAMFGPAHPRRAGRDGLAASPLDPALPGFGPFGTAGRHCFDSNHPAYRRIAAANAVRQTYPALRYGRQYPRPTRFLDRIFALHGPGELIAWSRILDDEELLCVLNPHGVEARGADILIDPNLNPAGGALTVVLNSARTDAQAPPSGHLAVGTRVESLRDPDGTSFVCLHGIGPSELVILANHPA